MDIKAQKQKQKIAPMAILLAVYCFLTYYFHAVGLAGWEGWCRAELTTCNY